VGNAKVVVQQRCVHAGIGSLVVAQYRRPVQPVPKQAITIGK